MVHGQPYKGFQTTPNIPVRITHHWNRERKKEQYQSKKTIDFVQEDGTKYKTDRPAKNVWNFVP
jgi:hypothetical protein